MTVALDEAFICDSVPAEIMDQLWAMGWRHFGTYFFRYSTQFLEGGIAQTIMPLRIDLEACTFSKSQRRVLKKNTDLRSEVTPAQLDDVTQAIFQSHRQRFRSNVPDSLETFVGPDPGGGPCECRMIRVYDDTRLVAASFLDFGQHAASSVYAVFEPEYAVRSLGIYTLLLEVEHCRQAGLRWLYPGYATHESSAYDYKKQFRGTAALDWSTGEWKDLVPV
ncbi:MAG: GNAT family N-acetyltransferase [Prosthecobacter sp.]